ncbi:MAG: PKD domain-containing protein, partial [Thermoplasmata archaeon]|nr:PKD domain-containing protein [Thermoplasmata archaeon]
MKQHPILMRFGRHKKLFLCIYVVYLLVVLSLHLATLMADTYIDDIKADMDPYYEEHLTWSADGFHPDRSHYYVERWDVGAYGYIVANYTTATNTLRVECTNIKVLEIRCRELYEYRAEELFKSHPLDDSNLYKRYFIEENGGRFNVILDMDEEMEELRFIDTPAPYSVVVNNEVYTEGREWWIGGAGINYTYEESEGIIVTRVPGGHTDVAIDFQSPSLTAFPIVEFTADKSSVRVNERISFNASSTYDPDGNIMAYIWDFGDGNFSTGPNLTNPTYAYSEPGDHTVILTARDNDYLLGRSYARITVYIDTAQPDAIISAPVENGSIGDVRCSFVISDQPGPDFNIDDDVTLFTLQYDNGTGWDELSSQEASPWLPGDGGEITWDSHELSDGTYIFRAIMTDYVGNVGTTPPTRATVDNEDPIAYAGPDDTVYEGEAYAFDGGGSTDNT